VIPFTVAGTGIAVQVILEIFDIRGRVVSRLLNEHLPAGNYTAVWRGTTVQGVPAASGAYFVRLRSAETVQLKRITLLR
jgi:flagellar hook assembly protein FlgD